MSVVINKQCLLWLWDRELVTHMPHICPCGLAKYYSVVLHGPVLVCKLSEMICNKVRTEIEIEGV